ncbi:unnamed protein product, partial [Scytosiphon promiscuus]
MKKFLKPFATVLSVTVIGAALLLSQGVLAEKAEVELQPNSFLGSYLAGRYASSRHDTAEAALYMRRALDNVPNNQRILEKSYLLEIMAG